MPHATEMMKYIMKYTDPYPGTEDLTVPLTFTNQGNTTASVRLNSYGTVDPINMTYSTDGIIFSVYTINTTITLTNKGDFVQFKGTNSTFNKDANNRYYFSVGGSIGASGNIMSLLDSTMESRVLPTAYVFNRLFNNCTTLVSAPLMPATTLTKSCYYSMYLGCSSLRGYIHLPATTIPSDAYNAIFGSCSVLDYIKVNFTSWSGTSNWVVQVLNTNGFFICPEALPIEYGTSKIPSGWTVVTF